MTEVRSPEETQLVEPNVDEELKNLLKQKALSLLKEKLNVDKINESVLVKFTAIVMELVEDTSVKGKDQKQLVIWVVNKIIDESDLTSDERKLYKLIVNSKNTHDTIELIVDASKGKLKLNKVKKVGLNCLLSCFK